MTRYWTLRHSGEDPRDCPYCQATAGFSTRELVGIHSFAVSRNNGRGTLTAPPSCRRFDVLGGPGGYLSARYVGAMVAGEYVDTWTRLVRVNVPRRLQITPRDTYGAVLGHYRAAGAMV